MNRFESASRVSCSSSRPDGKSHLHVTDSSAWRPMTVAAISTSRPATASTSPGKTSLIVTRRAGSILATGTASLWMDCQAFLGEATEYPSRTANATAVIIHQRKLPTASSGNSTWFFRRPAVSEPIDRTTRVCKSLFPTSCLNVT